MWNFGQVPTLRFVIVKFFQSNSNQFLVILIWSSELASLLENSLQIGSNGLNFDESRQVQNIWKVNKKLKREKKGGVSAILEKSLNLFLAFWPWKNSMEPHHWTLLFRWLFRTNFIILLNFYATLWFHFTKMKSSTQDTHYII